MPKSKKPVQLTFRSSFDYTPKVNFTGAPYRVANPNDELMQNAVYARYQKCSAHIAARSAALLWRPV